MVSHFNASINVAKIVWPLVTLIATILIACLMYRRYKKKKLIIGIYIPKYIDRITVVFKQFQQIITCNY